MAKQVYIFCWKNPEGKGIEGKPIACSNKRILAERSNLKYSNIVRIFTRQRKVYWEDEKHFIVRIYEHDIIRGKQHIKNQHKGFGGY